MLDRLSKLDENVGLLETFSSTGIRDKRDEWAVRYGLLESIQVVIDVACEVVAARNLGNPDSYRACIQLLARAELLENDLADRLTAMVGFRNLLVHEYDDIDPKRLVGALDELDDFRDFAQAMALLED
jgi:uncharacterized protein YutE (UPF0331/DUF86 family)